MEKSLFTAEYRALCSLLRKKREAAKLTQVQLAAKIKETQSEVSKIERGERRLDLVQLKQFCKAMNVSLVELVREFDALTSRSKR